ncbi:MAG: ferredoxin [Thermoprotei archaeon]|nr:MAG: ferredoxin [Thermoprotei archaeon]
MTYRVIVDRAKCVSCKAVATICPQVFVMGEDNGKSRVVDQYSKKLTDEISIGEIPDELYECVKEAADYCPVNAIVIEKVE